MSGNTSFSPLWMVFSPLAPKALYVDDIMVDPDMTTSCGMFFQKLTLVAFANGVIA